jgi:hypothetical protein
MSLKGHAASIFRVEVYMIQVHATFRRTVGQSVGRRVFDPLLGLMTRLFGLFRYLQCSPSWGVFSDENVLVIFI